VDTQARTWEARIGTGPHVGSTHWHRPARGKHALVPLVSSVVACARAYIQ
jgi:hypothetical protein